MIAIGSGLGGCHGGPPSQEQLDAADYGAPIDQSEAEQIATDWLHGHLKDPGSSQIQWGVVGPGWTRKAPIRGGGFVWGQRLDAEINAKNSFGGYTGYKPYLFMFFNGELTHVWGEQSMWNGYSYTSYMGRLK